MEAQFETSPKMGPKLEHKSRGQHAVLNTLSYWLVLKKAKKEIGGERERAREEKSMRERERE